MKGKSEKKGYLDIEFNKVARVTVYNLKSACFGEKGQSTEVKV